MYNKKEQSYVKVKVKITSQQYPLLERVLADGRLGNTENEVFRKAFLIWAQSIIGKEQNHE